MAPPQVSIVVPNWNGRRWLRGCLEAIANQHAPAAEVIVVDNGSTDGSVEYLRAEHPNVRLIALERNTGFAHAANVGLQAAAHELVALINTDVVLAPDWVARMSSTLENAPGSASVACKMLSLDDPARVYDAGDVLRRDGACEQRGRFGADDGRWDKAGEVFGACAGAALYRRSAVLEVGGFDERYFAYLEDVDLALRLRLQGWSCRYEPAVALHAGGGSSHQLRAGHDFLVTRNTLLLIAKAFPLRWLPFVAYRQLGWAWHALRGRALGAHLRALAAAVPMLPGALRARREVRAGAWVPIAVAVPARPFRGPRAGGHPAQLASPGRPISVSTSPRADHYACIVPVSTSERAPIESASQVRCAWCGAEARPEEGRLARCSTCGAATTYPRPDAAELEAAYAGWYRPEGGRFAGGGDRVLALSRASLARRLDRIAPPGPILDVGSGDGVLLRALRARGREAYGLEREAVGEGVFAREMDEFDERPGEWAAVVFWHSLEHVRDAAGSLNRAAALLRPGGVVVIAVPNLSSWQARFFGSRWFHLDLPRHLVHLPARALRSGLERRGLTIERMSYWRGGQLLFGWLHGLVGALPGHPDLYSAIRRTDARSTTMTGGHRAGVLAVGVAAAPVASVLVAGEVAAHAGGTIYVEARRP